MSRILTSLITQIKRLKRRRLSNLNFSWRFRKKFLRAFRCEYWFWKLRNSNFCRRWFLVLAVIFAINLLLKRCELIVLFAFNFTLGLGKVLPLLFSFWRYIFYLFKFRMQIFEVQSARDQYQIVLRRWLLRASMRLNARVNLRSSLWLATWPTSL